MLSKIEAIGIPYIYIAGNHDWHYEGMTGELELLRDKWIKKRLMPLYQGNNPLMAAYDIKGIRFLAIDNSTYEINDKQLIFFSEQVASGLPLVLLIHIPMYAPGKKISFGCGNPFWGASTDLNFELPNGSQALKYNHLHVCAFENFILKSKNAKLRYSSKQIFEAKKLLNSMSSRELSKLKMALLGGLAANAREYFTSKNSIVS